MKLLNNEPLKGGTEGQVSRMSDDRYLVAVELKNKHIDILKRALGGGENEDYWDDLENISESIILLIEQVGEMV